MAKAPPAVLVSLAAVFFSLPVLLYGFPVLAHDGPVHLLYTRQFGAQFWSGELYPRWLMGTHHGFGSPAFFVYAPLPYWVTSLLAPLGHVELSAAAVLALWGSGIAAWLWLRRVASEAGAVAGAVVYMGSAYHLTVDLYMRAAFAEFWSFVWFPFILLFTGGVIGRKPRALAGLAAVYALLVMTHLLSALIFSPLPLAYAWFLSKPGDRLRSLASVSLSLLLGTGLAAIYLLPALGHRAYLSSARYLLQPVYNWRNNFPPLDTRLFEIQGTWPEFVQFLSILIVLFALALACFASISRGRAARFWLAAGAASLLMTTPLSIPVWRLLPILAQLQLPWRFLMVATLAVSALSALSWGAPSRAAAAGLASIALLWLSFFGYMGYRISRQNHATAWSADFSMDPFLSDWTASAQANQAMERVRIESGQGSVDVLKWAPRDIRVRLRCPAGCALLFHQFYYPGWRVSGPAALEPSDQNLIRVKAPAGDYRLELRLDGGPWERAGQWVSAISLLALMLLLGLSGSPARPARSPA
ncbi:MAG TPA: 6-pyruvoyl-tetrahydropterin synthase-related protein [Bryobacteraceae bacterium]|nr:6-pyruvoyl-tetrahydropterin synthase-related protein [Bryobacteraceae bacterium]